MRLALLMLSCLPALAAGQGLPVLADFDSGLLSLGGSVEASHANLSLEGPGDFSTGGGSLRVAAVADGAEARLPLDRDGLDLARLSSSRSVIVVWKAEAAGSVCRVCLEGGTVAGELCAILKAQDTDWHESALALPPSADALAFRSPSAQPQPLKAQALSLRPQSGSAWLFDELRLDPPAASVLAEAVAAAFDSSPAQVRAARRLGLPELATWTLLLLSSRSGLSPAALAAERKTRSWGEISQAHGWAWGDLMDEVARRRAQAGLSLPESTEFQEHKMMENHAFDGVKP